MADKITIKTQVERENWAWVAAQAVREGKEKNEIMDAAIVTHRKVMECMYAFDVPRELAERLRTDPDIERQWQAFCEMNGVEAKKEVTK